MGSKCEVHFLSRLLAALLLLCLQVDLQRDLTGYFDLYLCSLVAVGTIYGWMHGTGTRCVGWATMPMSYHAICAKAVLGGLSYAMALTRLDCAILRRFPSVCIHDWSGNLHDRTAGSAVFDP